MSSAEARDLHWWKRVEVRSVVDDAVEKKKVVRKRSGGFGFRRGNDISIVAVPWWRQTLNYQLNRFASEPNGSLHLYFLFFIFHIYIYIYIYILN